MLIRPAAPSDPRLAPYRDLSDAVLSERDGLFIAEGRLVVRRLLESARLSTQSVMVTEPALAAIRDLIDVHSSLPVYVVPQTVMNIVAGFNIHRGCVALGERPPRDDWRALATHADRLMVVENVGNADNVGAIFRNAAAFGVDAVLLGPGCADPLYRKAIRTSMAAALSVPFADIDAWPDALWSLRGMGIAVIGLTPAAAALPLATIAASVRDERRRIALVVGHEGDGLSPGALAACDHLARIPMAPGVDSLNVATAAAIALYELTVRSPQ